MPALTVCSDDSSLGASSDDERPELSKHVDFKRKYYELLEDNNQLLRENVKLRSKLSRAELGSTRSAGKPCPSRCTRLA